MHCKTLLLLLAIVTYVTSAAQAQTSTAARPNVILIYTDDQRWDAMGCVQKEQGERGRFPWLTTPNMDRLASQGVRLRNAFVVNSLCAPSRSNFLTGKYSHLNGVANNHTPMPLDSVNFATILRDNGYATAYFGKFHHGSQKERPGFDTFASFIGQGKYEDCPVLINGKDTPTSGWIDDVTTDFAIDFLKSRKDGDKPFAMVIGFKSPHAPRTPPERAMTRFADQTPREVPNLKVRAPWAPSPQQPQRRGEAPAPREGLLNYFRVISAVDDNLGRIMDTLDRLRLSENTVLVFTSDNGFYLGEHGLGDKRSAYEESMRIPMIMRYPKSIPAGKTMDQMVLNIDVAPTFLDYAGAGIPKEMQGQSARDLLEGKSTKWRDSIFYEYFYERNFKSPTVTAVRTADAKLIEYPGHEEWNELFDLKNDPYEMKNLIKDDSAKALRERMEAEHATQGKALGFKIPDFADKSE